MSTTGATIYAVVRSRTATVYNTSSTLFETFSAGNWSLYTISLTEQGSLGYYLGTFPTAIAAGVYSLVAYKQVTGSPLVSDQQVATGDYQWSGTATVPLSDLATSGQIGNISPIRVARGTMVLNFPVYFKSSLDHVTPFVSGIISGQISRDGAAFTVLQSGAFLEKGLGWYSTSLTSGDLLANTISLVFTAVGISGGSADPVAMAMILQRTSGQV